MGIDLRRVSGISRGGSRLVLAVLAGYCLSCIRTAQPREWRLVCNVATTERWHVCNVKFFTDLQCSQAPSANFVFPRVNSSDSPTYTRGQNPEVFSEWASGCEECGPGDAWFGMSYSGPVVVRCVQWQECPEPTTTAAPTPAPNTTMPPTTMTMTTITGTTGPSTTNRFQGIGEQLNDLEGERRLVGAAFPSQLELQRSDTGSNWITVGTFDWPYLNGGKMKLDDLTTRPRQTEKAAASSYTPDSTRCSACGSDGIEARAELEMIFSENIFRGSSSIKIERGGGLENLDVEVSNTNWFQVVDNKLRIKPQANLAGSGSCSTISIPATSLMDADGFDLAQGYSYVVCIVDSRPPEIQSTDPDNGRGGVPLRPDIRLAFNEEVRINSSVSLTFVPTLTGATSIPYVKVQMDAPNVRERKWKTGASEVVIQLQQQQELRIGTRYNLMIPAGAIKDLAGNPFAGGTVLRFTTLGATTPRPPAIVASTNSSGDGGGAGSSGGISVGVILGIAAAIVVLCGVGAALLLWRYTVQQKHMGGKLFQESNNRKKVAPVTPGQSTTPFTSAADTEKTSSGKTADSWRAGASPKPGGAGGASPKAGTESGGPRSAGLGGDAPRPAPDERPQSSPAAKSKPRSREAEDVSREPHRKPPPPFNKGGKRPRRGASFTEESAEGDWVKTVDPATGQTYWFHRKTLETRWDKPTGGTPKPKAQKEPPTADLSGDIKNLEEAEGVARVKEDILQQLQKTRTEDIASRKKTFKFMQLKWHPDKNPDDAELATAVFQFLQEKKDWYLEET